MYNSNNVAERINFTLKAKNIQQKIMLEECHLNRNTISSMLSRGSMIKADSLAKIADYLDVSVDYLLGRTNYPNIVQVDDNGQPIISPLTPSIANKEGGNK